MRVLAGGATRSASQYAWACSCAISQRSIRHPSSLCAAREEMPHSTAPETTAGRPPSLGPRGRGETAKSRSGTTISSNGTRHDPSRYIALLPAANSASDPVGEFRPNDTRYDPSSRCSARRNSSARTPAGESIRHVVPASSHNSPPAWANSVMNGQDQIAKSIPAMSISPVALRTVSLRAASRRSSHVQSALGYSTGSPGWAALYASKIALL